MMSRPASPTCRPTSRWDPDASMMSGRMRHVRPILRWTTRYRTAGARRRSPCDSDPVPVGMPSAMDGDRDFRFSPRPNRAAEIRWRPWGEPAFAEARRLGRPVLLSLSAVWCHWCHVMDETSYSDPRVIAAVNEHFVPDPRGQRPPPGREPPLQHGRLADDRLPRRQRRRPHRRHLPAARPDAREPGARQGVLRRQPGGDPRAGGRARPRRRRRRDGQPDRTAAERRAGARGPRRRPGRTRRHLRRGGAAGRARLRPALRRPRRGAQVPAGRRVRLHARLRACCAAPATPSTCPKAAARCCGRRACRRWCARRSRPWRRGGMYDDVERRLLPLRDAARLERAALREDARGQRPPRRAVPRGVARTPADHDLGDPELYRHAGEGAIDYLLGDAVARRRAGLRRQPGRRRGVLPAGRRRSRRAAGAVRRSDRLRRLERAGGAGAAARRLPCSGARSSPTAPCGLLDHLWDDGAARRRHGALRARRTAPSATARRSSPTRRRGGGAARRLRGHRRAALAAPRPQPRRAGRASTCAPRTAACCDRLAVPGESAGLLAQPVPALDENAAHGRGAAAPRGVHRRGAPPRAGAARSSPPGRRTTSSTASPPRPTARRCCAIWSGPTTIVVVGRRDDDEARRLHAAALAAPTPLRTVQWLDPADRRDAERMRLRAGGRPALPSRPRPRPTSAAATRCSLFRP